MDTDSQACLTELRDVLANTQRWGILIVEGFDIVKFSFSMFITIGISSLIGIAAPYFGRTTGGSLRASFISMFAFVALLGVFPHPSLTDVMRDVLTKRRMLVFLFCLLAAMMMSVFTYVMTVSVRVQTGFLVLNSILLLIGFFY